MISYLGLKPYHMTLSLVKFGASYYDSKLEIWPRNSYVFGAIEPGFSDLDLTLYVPKQCDASKAYKFLYLIDKFRKIWPLIGEVNLYFENELNFCLKHINKLELSRDKFLVKRMNYDFKFSASEAAVFLFRQLEKDVKNLARFPQRRLKKWNYHFEQVQYLLPENLKNQLLDLQHKNLVDSIVSVIVFLCGANHSIFINDLNEKLQMYFEFLIKDVDLSKLRPLVVKDPWIYVFAIHKISFLEIAPVTLSIAQQQILSLQIKWELWGLKTQLNEQNAKRISTHKKYLLEKLEKQNQFQCSAEFVNIIETQL